MTESDPQLVIEAVATEHQAAALRCLHLGHTQILRLLERHQRGELNLDGLFHALRRGRLVGAAWGQILPGNMGHCWPAVVGRREPIRTARRLQAAADRFLDSSGIQLTQAVIDPTAEVYARELQQAGYRHLTDLALLVCGPSDLGPLPSPGGLHFEAMHQNDRPRLTKILHQTYHNSLDCSELDGLRAPEDVLESYYRTGTFRPDWWLIARSKDQDIGCVLLADHPACDQCELVYMGLVPEFRGQGRGLQLARHAQRLALAASRGRLTLAVDQKNWPARALYSAAGFQQWDTRSVFLRQQIDRRGSPS